MWILLTLFAAFCLAFSRILQKKLLQDNFDPITFSIFFQIAVALLLLPVALLSRFTIPPLEGIWPQIIVMILLYTGANITIYLALKKIPVSEFVIISALIPLVTVVSSIPFLKESGSPIKLLGIFLTIFGISIAFYTRQRFHFNRGHLLAFLSALCFGLAFTNDGFLLHHFTAPVYSVAYFLLPAIFLAIIFPKKVGTVKSYVTKKSGLGFLTTSILFACSSLAINHSYQSGGEISQISAVLQLNTILAIVLGILFLKERQNITRKITGGFIVVCGIILVQSGL